MYESMILRTIARVMLPLLLLLSLFMVVRGHHLPGGGFVGGLLASAAIILQIVAFGPDYAREIVPVNYLRVAAIGVGSAACWGLLALIQGEPFMAARWLDTPIPGIGKLDTPVMFDIGVYLTVIGVTTQLALVLAEEPGLYTLRRSPPSPTEPVAPEA
jgi:multicomponent Na+:H+ antiporter subunit B